MKFAPLILLLLLPSARAETILFLVGEAEYGTKQSLPEFAKSELEPRGHTCRFVYAKSADRKSPDCHLFPGFAEALNQADLLFVSVRRRYPPKADLELIRKWIADGKPVMGIRTSSHAFGEREKGPGYQAPPGHAAWNDFDRDVFGTDYEGHARKSEGACRIRVPHMRGDHPLLRDAGVKAGTEVATHLYYSRKLDKRCFVALEGYIEGKDIVEPVAWTLQRGKGRAFYTSLGGVEDFKLPFFRRLLVNAVDWSLGRAAPKEAPDPKQSRSKVGADDPLSAGAAFRTFVVPEDLEVDLLLSEPVVQQPVFFNFDERGRMWLVQYRQYPEPAGLKLLSKDKHWRAVYNKVPPPPGDPDYVPGKDRITIHEDTNGDGRFDNTKIFLDGLNLATGFVRGKGGVWVLMPPYLLFYPDANDDDVPDGTPVVHLRGFGIEDTHSICNSLCWGPDGWLYAAQGSTVSSAVTVEGSDAPPIRRQGQLMWRYHPPTKRYEVFAEGGGNIWSCEFDSKGRLFAGSNGSHPGFFYLQGAYYRKNFGKHGELSNPYAYGFFEGIRHPNFKRVTTSICVYEGGALPERYDGALVWANPVIGRFGASTLERDGLSFKGDYIDLLIHSDHRWFRPVYTDFGPDGALYVSDWYDQQVNHYRNYEGRISKQDGRVYRVRAKGAKPIQPFDLRKKSDLELVELLKHDNRWWRETARRLLRERPHTQKSGARLMQYLKGDDGQLALEALWVLMGWDLLFECVDAGLEHRDPQVRQWTVRFMSETPRVQITVAGNDYFQAARAERDLEVRAQFASGTRYQHADYALGILQALMEWESDLEDSHLAGMFWWALEQQAADPFLVLDSLDGDRFGVNGYSADLRWAFWKSRWMTRPKGLAHLLVKRLASGEGPDFRAALSLCFKADVPSAVREDMARGFMEAYKGRPMTGLPEELVKALQVARPDAIDLQWRLGDDAVLPALEEKLTNRGCSPDERLRIIEALAERPAPSLLEPLLIQLDSSFGDHRKAAFAALSRLSDKKVGATVAGKYASLHGADRDHARALLCSRAAWSHSWVQAVKAGKIPADAVPADAVRDMQRHLDDRLNATIDEIWPPRAPLVFEKEIQRVHAVVAGGGGDPYRGRELYLQRCGACHYLHNEGGRIGPDLTAYQRGKLDDLLLAIVHPNAEIREGFETVSVKTKDGRMISGFLTEQNEQRMAVRPVGGNTVIVPRKRVARTIPVETSLMPPGLLTGLADAQLKDLFSYLRSSQPLPVKKR